MIAVINIFSIIAEFLISIGLYKKISSGKKTPIAASVVLLSAFAIQCLNNFYFLGKSQFVLLISISVMFLLSFIYKMPFFTRIWSCLLLFIIGALSEFAIAFSSTLIFNVDTLKTQTDPILLALCTIAAKFLSFIIVRTLRFKKNSKGIFNFSISFSVLPLPLATLLIVVLLYSCCYEIEKSVFKIIALAASLLLIGANFFMIDLIERNNEHTKTKAQLEFSQKQILQQTLHYEELYQWQSDMKKFRHDINNQLTCILGLLQNGENEEAINTIKKGLNIINFPDKLQSSGNPVLDSIIHSKIEFAKIHSIQIKSCVKLNEAIVIDSTELGIITGNAIDNAIEAVSQLPKNTDLEKSVHIQILSVRESISIEVTNPVQHKVDIHNLSSTKTEKEFHGMGIKIMQSLVEKYDGHLYFSCENNIFSTNIILSNVPR